jgi:hypothetical protein
MGFVKEHEFHFGYPHTTRRKWFFILVHGHFSNSNTFHALEALSTIHYMNFMLNSIQVDTVQFPYLNTWKVFNLLRPSGKFTYYPV